MADDKADEQTDAQEEQQEEQLDPTLEAFATEGVEGAVKPNDVTEDPFAEDTAEDESSDEEQTEDETEQESEGDESEADEGEDKGEEVSEDKPPAGQTESTEEAADTRELDATGVYDDKPAEDPGEFKPQGDYAFDVKLADGSTRRISSVDEADKFQQDLDNNPELITAGQFALFNRKASAMESGIAAEQAAYNKDKAAFDAQQAQAETRNNIVQGINNGMNYLQSKGLLEPVPAELNTADVRWEDHTDNSAIKQRLDILKYMEAENTARAAAGLEPSFDVVAAHNAMELDRLRQADAQETTDSRNKSRAKASVITGRTQGIVQPTQTTPGRITGTGGTLDDLVTEFASQ